MIHQQDDMFSDLSSDACGRRHSYGRDGCGEEEPFLHATAGFTPVLHFDDDAAAVIAAQADYNTLNLFSKSKDRRCETAIARGLLCKDMREGVGSEDSSGKILE